MIHFTKYAEEKFDILNKHKVFFTKEEIEDVIKLPDETGRINSKNLTARKNKIKVIYREEDDMVKIITFYPVK